MNVSFIRILFVLICTVVGYQLSGLLFGVSQYGGLYGAIVGSVFAIVIVLGEKMTDNISLTGLSAAVFGLILALILSNLVSRIIGVMDINTGIKATINIALTLMFSYMGIVLSMRGRDEFNIIIPYVKFQRQDQSGTPVILDTSAIIDGRVADLVKTNFLEGYFIVPKSVLKELHAVADSADEQKRMRGRRGLDILNKLKKNSQFHFKLHPDDSIEGPVDQRLIQLAKVLSARIMTTDYNLNKVAEIHGVTVLNVNELANAVKPALIPGETLTVQPIKEGRERNQAVAYLSDGTMVVVEDARGRMGENLVVKVTSALQTAAGRMIFAKIDDSAQG